MGSVAKQVPGNESATLVHKPDPFGEKGADRWNSEDMKRRKSNYQTITPDQSAGMPLGR